MMNHSEKSALNLVGMVYDAALDEHKWPSFLEAFASAVGGSSSILRSADMKTSTAGFVASSGYDPDWQLAYCNHFVKVDYLIPALFQFKEGEVKTSDQVFSISEQRNAEFYNDYFVPQDKLHAMGALLVKNGNHTLLLAAQSGKQQGEFGEEAVRLMELLIPHVTRAVQVHRKINTVSVEKEWALGALDQVRMGVILTNGHGAPLFVNHAAELMLTQRGGIGIRQDRLFLHLSSESAHFYQLVGRAAMQREGGDMRISLAGGNEFLHCQITPVSSDFSARWNIASGSGCVAVFLSKPGSLQLSPARLAALYRLTPAEARLAAKLAEFRSVDQAAADIGVAIHTVRTQLKSIFAKTGAKSQSELLMLLATGTLACCRDETS
jgi:DNA-binding CsgD family transcriptional regulator